MVPRHLTVSEDGRPTVYYQSLHNTPRENLTHIVLPILMTPIVGARFLQTFQFHAQLVYHDSADERSETSIKLAYSCRRCARALLLIAVKQKRSVQTQERQRKGAEEANARPSEFVVEIYTTENKFTRKTRERANNKNTF